MLLTRIGTRRVDDFTLLFTDLVADGAVEPALCEFGGVSIFGCLHHLLAVVKPFVLVFGFGLVGGRGDKVSEKKINFVFHLAHLLETSAG